jgi:hypothetical protein
MNVLDDEPVEKFQRIKRRRERIWKAKRSHNSTKPPKKYDGKHRRRIRDICW